MLLKKFNVFTKFFVESEIPQEFRENNFLYVDFRFHVIFAKNSMNEVLKSLHCGPGPVKAFDVLKNFEKRHDLTLNISLKLN